MDFFISYARDDRDWAERIARYLKNAGYSVEYDLSYFVPGDNYVNRMEEALESAGAVLVIASENYARSTYAATELSGALVRGRGRILPVRIDDTQPPPILQPIVALNLNGVGIDELEARVLAAAAEIIQRNEPSTSADPERLPADTIRDSDSKVNIVITCANEDQGLAQAICTDIAGAQLPALATVVPISGSRVASQDVSVPGVLDADLILPVVSRDFIATGYGDSREMQELVALHRQRSAVVIPVIARECAWRRQVYGRLSTLPRGGSPVSSYDSRDVALRAILEGVRLAIRQILETNLAETPTSAPEVDRAIFALKDVFMPTGVPTHTFVEPDYFPEFCLVLEQPGLGIVLEGPSGVGKTTILRWAVKRQSDDLGEVRILSARSPAEMAEIERLPDGHRGIVAVDDFHRLPPALQDRLSDYAKTLADQAAPQKLVIVGIPGTARHLVEVASDLATRMRVFQPEPVPQSLVVQMIEKGEAALNISFTAKAEIALASAGSLLTAQTLCWQLAGLAGVKRTAPERVQVETDLEYALTRVAASLALKYGTAVQRFVELDGEHETTCIDLLLELGGTVHGILPLDQVSQSAARRAVVRRVFLEGPEAGSLMNDPQIREHLYLDRRGQRLIADDPQFLFYLRRLGRDQLMVLSGKRGSTNRTQAFVCYSHRDQYWLGRLLVHLDPLQRADALDVWSDTRIQIGDEWREEISRALDLARVAIILVSADMLASDFIRNEELPRLLKRAEEGGCRIIPLLVGPSAFSRTPSLNRYQSPNTNGLSLSEIQRPEAEVVMRDLGLSLAKLLGVASF